ncbi:MAG: hypothetical protein ABR607_17450, partial [Pyrinomonadaceae bacterium]
SATQLGLVNAARGLPFLFFGMIAGVYADRSGRKVQLVAAQATNVALNLVLVGTNHRSAPLRVRERLAAHDHGRDLVDHVLAAEQPTFGAGLLTAAFRAGPEFTRFDGNVGPGRIDPLDDAAPIRACSTSPDRRSRLSSAPVRPFAPRERASSSCFIASTSRPSSCSISARSNA